MSVDPPGIEPGLPQCECGVLPLDYGPTRLLIISEDKQQEEILWLLTLTLNRLLDFHISLFYIFS